MIFLEKYKWYWEKKNESKVSDWQSDVKFTENLLGLGYLEWEGSVDHPPSGDFQQVAE